MVKINTKKCKAFETMTVWGEEMKAKKKLRKRKKKENVKQEKGTERDYIDQTVVACWKSINVENFSSLRNQWSFRVKL